MQYLVNGAQFDVFPTRGLAVAISAITNAANPVATAASAPDDNSIIVLESSWAGINGKPVRSSGKAGNNFVLTGLDTANTSSYPAELNTGSYVIMADPFTLDQVTGIDMSGGDQNSVDWNYVEDPTGEGQSMPTNKNPLVLTFTLHYDPDRPWYEELIAVDEAKTPIVVRERLPSSRVNLFAGYMSFQKFATRAPNEIQTVTAVLRVNKSMQYAASTGS